MVRTRTGCALVSQQRSAHRESATARSFSSGARRDGRVGPAVLTGFRGRPGALPGMLRVQLLLGLLPLRGLLGLPFAAGLLLGLPGLLALRAGLMPLLRLLPLRLFLLLPLLGLFPR